MRGSKTAHEEPGKTHGAQVVDGCRLFADHRTQRERIGSVRCDSVPFLLLVDGDDGRYRQRRLPRCQRSLLDTPCAVTGDLKPIILEGR